MSSHPCGRTGSGARTRICVAEPDGAVNAVRVALVSDIHGNGVALRALLADLDAAEVDEVVCLGDVGQGGPAPVAAIDAVRERRWKTVMGNSDAFLLDPHASDEPVTERHLQMREWSCAQLGSDRLDFIASFSPTVEVALSDSLELLAFHGSPRSFDEVVLPTLDLADHQALVADHDANVFAGGHIHLQWLRRLGARTWLCPGSVGLSYDHDQSEDDLRFDPWAAYALLTLHGEATEISFRRVPFDYREVISEIDGSGMTDADYSRWRWDPRA